MYLMIFCRALFFLATCVLLTACGRQSDDSVTFIDQNAEGTMTGLATNVALTIELTSLESGLLDDSLFGPNSILGGDGGSRELLEIGFGMSLCLLGNRDDKTSSLSSLNDLKKWQALRCTHIPAETLELKNKTSNKYIMEHGIFTFIVLDTIRSGTRTTPGVSLKITTANLEEAAENLPPTLSKPNYILRFMLSELDSFDIDMIAATGISLRDIPFGKANLKNDFVISDKDSKNSTGAKMSYRVYGDKL